MKPLLLEELSPTDLKKIIEDDGIVYLPLGTLEWHQHHLPFGVDALISYHLCLKASQKTGGCVVPPLYFGTDREHKINGKILHGMDSKAGRILPGNLYFLKEDLFYKLIKQIITNVSEQGFTKLVIVSGHSGTAQQRTIEKFSNNKFKQLKVIVIPGKTFAGGMDHAGEIETRLMMAIRPNLVNISRLKNQEEPLEGLIGEHPLKASKAEGEDQFSSIVDQIVNLVSKG